MTEVTSPQSEALYKACIKNGSDKLYSQEDLESLNVISPPDVQLLAECIDHLVGHQLFRPMSRDGKAYWKPVLQEDAQKYRGLTQDEVLVLSYVQEAGQRGIWVKHIRNKTNLPDVSLNKQLKSLLSKNLIKPTADPNHHKRKFYMLSTLQPSDDVTNGVFYDDGEVDKTFVDHCSWWLLQAIGERSWIKRTVKNHRDRKPHPDSVQTPTYEESAKHAYIDEYLHHDPGYHYPTLSELTLAANAADFSRVVLKEEDVEKLLQLLIWDGILEKRRVGGGYKTVRPPRWNSLPEAHDKSHDPCPLAETPCGPCPVSDLCDESGPVNAKTCEYFPKW